MEQLILIGCAGIIPIRGWRKFLLIIELVLNASLEFGWDK
jgi:hypothetical protein